MSERQIVIFMRDNSSTANQELMKFLYKNLELTAKCGNYIIPQVVPKYKEREFSKKHAVSVLPASIHNGEKYEGAKRIKKLISSMCTPKNVLREKTQEEMDIEDLRNHHANIMNSGDEDNANEEEEVQNRLAQGAAMTKARRESINGQNNTDLYKDIDDNIQVNSQYVPASNRPDNIIDDDDITQMALDDVAENDDNMDAFMEKIKGATNAGF